MDYFYNIIVICINIINIFMTMSIIKFEVCSMEISNIDQIRVSSVLIHLKIIFLAHKACCIRYLCA